MSDGDKNSVISKVVDSLISLPVYASKTLMVRKSILTKLKRDIYGKNGIEEWTLLQRRKNDQQWIEDRRRDLNEVYDIENFIRTPVIHTPVIHTPETVNLVSPAKRKKPEGTEFVSKCFVFCNACIVCKL